MTLCGGLALCLWITYLSIIQLNMEYLDWTVLHLLGQGFISFWSFVLVFVFQRLFVQNITIGSDWFIHLVVFSYNNCYIVILFLWVALESTVCTIFIIQYSSMIYLKLCGFNLLQWKYRTTHNLFSFILMIVCITM